MAEENSKTAPTPPKIREAANLAVQHLLPAKSKGRYEVIYSKFMQWCKENNIKNYSENCLLAYFQIFPNKKSLWPTYSMLKSCLNIYNHIDISKYSKLIAYLKRETQNQQRKKSKILEMEQIQTFMSEAPDSTFLLTKAALIMGICGALRREELCKMSIDDIEFKKDVVFVTVPETKNSVVRRFAVTEVEWIKLLLKYKDLRATANKRFFLTYRNGRCVNSPVGINTIGKIPSQIATFLNLDNPSEYTGHCFRRSSATLLANHGGDLLTLKRHGGWRSSAVAESYVENSLHSKKIIANKLLQPGPSSVNETCMSTSRTVNVTQSLSTATQVAPSTLISNCQNFTINVYNNTCSSCGSSQSKNVVN